MAYLNEFPHVEANKLNLDWILEQYSTFDKRLQELHDHFDEAVAQMQESFDQAVNQFQASLNSFELQITADFNAYKNLVNSTISAFETQITGDFDDFKREVNAEVATVADALDQVSEHVVTYVSQHISEWTLDASSIDIQVPQTLNTETYGNITLPNVTVTQKPVILSVSRETHAGGGAPYINHFDDKYVNGDIYPKIETAWANDAWNITIRDKAPDSLYTSKTYTVFYTIM